MNPDGTAYRNDGTGDCWFQPDPCVDDKIRWMGEPLHRPEGSLWYYPKDCRYMRPPKHIYNPHPEIASSDASDEDCSVRRYDDDRDETHSAPPPKTKRIPKVIHDIDEDSDCQEDLPAHSRSKRNAGQGNASRKRARSSSPPPGPSCRASAPPHKIRREDNAPIPDSSKSKTKQPSSSSPSKSVNGAPRSSRKHRAVVDVKERDVEESEEPRPKKKRPFNKIN